MTRPQPSAFSGWILRWLLVVSTLAGMGIWQGAHCADAMGTQPVVAASTPIAAAHIAEDSAHPRLHVETRNADSDDSPQPSFDDCHVVPATAVGTVMGTVFHLPAGVRTARVVPASSPPPTRLQPAVMLVKIGISRI